MQEAGASPGEAGSWAAFWREEGARGFSRQLVSTLQAHQDVLGGPLEGAPSSSLLLGAQSLHRGPSATADA